MNGSERQCPETITDHIRPAMVSVVVTFMPVSAIGNLVIIVAIARTKSLRTNVNILIVSVAAIDIFSTLCLQPLDVLYYINFPNYPHSPTITKLWNALFFALVTSSVYSLCAINLERFIALKFALNYLSWITTERIYFSIAVIWSYSMLTFIVIALIQDTPREGQFLFLVTNQFYVALLVVNIMVPMAISFLAALYISAVARRHLLQIRNMGKMYNLSRFQDTLSSSSRERGRSQQIYPDVEEESVIKLKTQDKARNKWLDLLRFQRRFKKMRITREGTTSSSVSTTTEDKKPVDYECPIVISVKMIDEGKETATTEYDSINVQHEHVQTYKELNVSTLQIGKLCIPTANDTALSDNTNSVRRPSDLTPTSMEDTVSRNHNFLSVHKIAAQTLNPNDMDDKGDASCTIPSCCLSPKSRVINVKPKTATDNNRSEARLPERRSQDSTNSNNNEHIVNAECSSALCEDYSVTGGIQLVNRRSSSTSTQRYRQKKAVKRWSHLRREFKTLRLVVILSFCFFLCWCPFLINQYLLISDAIPYTCLEEYLDLSLGWLTYWNSVINVFIYAGFNNDFRKAYKQVMCGFIRSKTRDRRARKMK